MRCMAWRLPSNITLPTLTLLDKRLVNGTVCDDDWVAPFTGVVFFILPLAVPYWTRGKGRFLWGCSAAIGMTALLASCTPLKLSLAWCAAVVAYGLVRSCRGLPSVLGDATIVDIAVVAAVSLASLVATVWTIVGASVGEEEERRGVVAAGLLAMAGVVHSVSAGSALPTTDMERRSVGGVLVFGVVQALMRVDATGIDVVVAAGLLCFLSKWSPSVPLVPVLAVAVSTLHVVGPERSMDRPHDAVAAGCVAVAAVARLFQKLEVASLGLCCAAGSVLMANTPMCAATTLCAFAAWWCEWVWVIEQVDAL